MGGRGLVFVVLALLLGAPASARAQAGGPLGLGGCIQYHGSEGTTDPGTFGRLPDQYADIPSSRDGRPLELGIVRPDGPAGYRAPVILWASPYFNRRMRDLDLEACAPWLIKNFVAHGYAVALAPMRGTGNTDGCPNLFGKIERTDLDDILNYLGTRDWSNGNVAMYGVSYDGSTPWVAASTGNPHLKTILPAEGVNDLFDLAFGAGTLDWRWWFFVSGYYHQYGPLENNPLYSGRDPDRTVNAVTACPDVAQGEAATLESGLTSEHDHFGYWAERNQRPRVERRYHGSVLLLQGLQDWNVRPAHAIPWAVSLRKRGLIVHELLGQWKHAAPDGPGSEPHTRYDFADLALAWFDRFLKGDATADIGPRVEVEDDTGHWRRARRWPVPNRTHLQLTAAKTIATTATPATATAVLAPDSRSRYFFLADNLPESDTDDSQAPVPSSIDELCATCVAFTEKVTEPTRIAGLPVVHVTVTPTAPSGHVSAFLYRKDANGLQRIGWGETDLRFPRGENFSRAGARAIIPGQPLNVRIQLEPLEALVGAGQQLVLVLSQGHSSQMPGRPPAPVALSYGGGTSRLDLPVAHPSPDEFFTPPAKPARPLP
jgi:X-Pro dipeptidyl-peptidase